MKLQKRTLVVFMAIAVLLLTFGVSAAQDTTVNVTLGMSEFKFEPNALNVAQGTEVTFNVSNTGQFPHNVTFVAPDGTETNLFENNLTAGQSATGKFTFNAPGEWKMYCPVGQHEEQGMVGTVTVAAAAQSGVGASQTVTSTQATTGTQGTTSAATPSTLPTTGGMDPLIWAAATALVLVGGGLWFRRSGAMRG